jgi:hypothetical protein
MIMREITTSCSSIVQAHCIPLKAALVGEKNYASSSEVEYRI